MLEYFKLRSGPMTHVAAAAVAAISRAWGKPSVSQLPLSGSN